MTNKNSQKISLNLKGKIQFLNIGRGFSFVNSEQKENKTNPSLSQKTKNFTDFKPGNFRIK
jgi:hypothetical protein